MAYSADSTFLLSKRRRCHYSTPFKKLIIRYPSANPHSRFSPDRLAANDLESVNATEVSRLASLIRLDLSGNRLRSVHFGRHERYEIISLKHEIMEQRNGLAKVATKCVN